MKILKIIAMLVVSCFILPVINLPLYSYTIVGYPQYSQDYNLQKECVIRPQAVKQVLKSSFVKKVSVNDEKVKKIQKEKDGNGQEKYYAIISDGTMNINVEIPNNLFQYLLNNKISKENVTITINDADAKGSINGNYIVNNTDAQITINIITDFADDIYKNELDK